MKDVAVNKIRDLFDDLKKDKKTLVKILFIAMILLIAAILRISGANGSSVNLESADTAEVIAEENTEAEYHSAEVCVDIGGQVVNPGVYHVSDGTRLYQLIELAGGLTDNADTDSINRASFVEDGEKIMIPSKAAKADSSDPSVSAEGDSASLGLSAGGLVNINLANKEELKTLNGIGDVTADKIIEYRKSNRFKKKEDIKSVKGIGDAIYEKIKDNITC